MNMKCRFYYARVAFLRIAPPIATVEYLRAL
jgi:hypothetical protein